MDTLNRLYPTERSSRPEAPGDGGLRLTRGHPHPLGATVDAAGVNFAVFAGAARAVTLCLLDERGVRETARIPMTERSEGVWHGHLAGAVAGQVYGYRVDGPNEPERGRRFDSAKLLLDPYARRIVGSFRWSDSHHRFGVDNLSDTLKAAVTGADDFDWGDDRAPRTPLEESVLYEVHVKGFTRRHPAVPEAQRGTYAGFASDPAIAHLKKLGVTAVNLLPVHAHIAERPLAERGLVNYWGYSTIGFFAPERRYAGGDPVGEFKAMVRRLHQAGIEVILDVVFNHTAEGDHSGPVVSFKGLDNEAYYHLRSGHPGLYENYTGTGNAVNLNHPRVLQLVMDSLRYWVGEMRVDGFRFDLATTLGRGPNGFDSHAAFFQCVGQDPLLAQVKLIAEPWDIGFGGYQVGRFPGNWSEWNDRYRDSVRSFWVRKAAYRGEIASRIAGSSELFRNGDRKPQAGVNYVTAHDGFTLHDLVSYNDKHNQANGENNRDGQSENHSWNCGIEGPTDLLAINVTRGRIKRALLATLFVSQGVPMLLAGDEMGRSQQGNNNAYCQDNEIGWLDWRGLAEEPAAGGVRGRPAPRVPDAEALARPDPTLVEFTARLIALRRRYPQLRRTAWLTGAATATGGRDVVWLNRQGEEMNRRQWEEWGRYAFSFLLGAAAPGENDLMVMMNGEASDWATTLPSGRWQVLLDTAQADGRPDAAKSVVQSGIVLKGRSLRLLERLDAPQPAPTDADAMPAPQPEVQPGVQTGVPPAQPGAGAATGAASAAVAPAVGAPAGAVAPAAVMTSDDGGRR